MPPLENLIRFGDARAILSVWAEVGMEAQMCVTSPPYWGLRDYGVPGQIGSEPTPEEYVYNLVECFRQVRKVLRPDGTLWLNLGDSYCSSTGCGKFRPGAGRADGLVDSRGQRNRNGVFAKGLKPKDLVGIPWMLAFALRADGWYLRQDIIWAKPNPMPESVRDRCTRSHEYLFLLSKSKRYYYDGNAIAEPCKPTTISRVSQTNYPNQAGSDRVLGKTNGPMKACFGGRIKSQASKEQSRLHSGNEDNGSYIERGANKRSVWWISTKPYKEAHFATFPPDLISPCVLAGSRPGDIILDPFIGSGTTAQVAIQLGRRYLGCELNPSYEPLINERLAKVQSAELASD